MMCKALLKPTTRLDYELQRAAKDMSVNIEEKLKVVIEMNGGSQEKALHFLMSLLTVSNQCDPLDDAIGGYLLDQIVR